MILSFGEDFVVERSLEQLGGILAAKLFFMFRLSVDIFSLNEIWNVGMLAFILCASALILYRANVLFNPWLISVKAPRPVGLGFPLHSRFQSTVAVFWEEF